MSLWIFHEDVTIHEFTINGAQGTIDNENMTVKVMLPPKSEVTSLTPVIEIADQGYGYSCQWRTTEFFRQCGI
ncbi:hypothetical protein NXV73_16475 [Bacteroides salyersiae]|nr:hypothetical protein [Bacteroides salyersiae]